MSQGVAGHAGYQLSRARDPRPKHFFPLHGGVGPDFTERMEKREVGRPRFPNPPASLGYLSFVPQLMVVADWNGLTG